MNSLLRQSLEREIQHDKLIAQLSKNTVKGRVERQHIVKLASLLEPFLVSICDALEVAAKYSKDPHSGRAVTFAVGQIIQYCFDEEDLFPESHYGILGLLDDAYLVHRFAAMLSMSNVGVSEA
jgi:hypothetical protein